MNEQKDQSLTILNWSRNSCSEAASPAGLGEPLKLPVLSVKPIYKNNILVLTVPSKNSTKWAQDVP